jgi:hypothetical protein
MANFSIITLGYALPLGIGLRGIGFARTHVDRFERTLLPQLDLALARHF